MTVPARVVLVVGGGRPFLPVEVVVARVVLVVASRRVGVVLAHVVVVVTLRSVVLGPSGFVLVVVAVATVMTVAGGVPRVVLVSRRRRAPVMWGLRPEEVVVDQGNRVVDAPTLVGKTLVPGVGPLPVRVAFLIRSPVVALSLALEAGPVVAEADRVVAGTWCGVVGEVASDVVAPPRPDWRRAMVWTVVAVWTVVVVVARRDLGWCPLCPWREEVELRRAGCFPRDEVVSFGRPATGPTVEVDPSGAVPGVAVSGVTVPITVVAGPIVVGARVLLVVPAAASGAALGLLSRS